MRTIDGVRLGIIQGNVLASPFLLVGSLITGHRFIAAECVVILVMSLTIWSRAYRFALRARDVKEDDRG